MNKRLAMVFFDFRLAFSKLTISFHLCAFFLRTTLPPLLPLSGKAQVRASLTADLRPHSNRCCCNTNQTSAGCTIAPLLWFYQLIFATVSSERSLSDRAGFLDSWFWQIVCQVHRWPTISCRRRTWSRRQCCSVSWSKACRGGLPPLYTLPAHGHLGWTGPGLWRTGQTNLEEEKVISR